MRKRTINLPKRAGLSPGIGGRWPDGHHRRGETRLFCTPWGFTASF